MRALVLGGSAFIGRQLVDTLLHRGHSVTVLNRGLTPNDLPDDVEGPEVGLGTYPVITGEYSGFPRWESTPVVAGTPIPKPAPVFTKLDPDVVGEELARLGKAPEPAAESS